MWTAMAAIALLFVLSIYGAFIGSRRAREFFNSVPLAAYWIVFIILLAIGIILFQRLRHVPALLLMHIGCIFILIGGLWGSKAGHQLRRNIFGTEKFLNGVMYVFEGHMENHVELENGTAFELPFSIGLKDFRIEYYKIGDLYIQTRQGDFWSFPAEEDKEFSLGPDFGTVKILRVFENFRINLEDENRTAIDDPGSGSNPAIHVQVTPPGGQPATRYVFENFQGHMDPGDELFMAYGRDISDYISELQVIENNRAVKEKNIEVNHPLHYGGYHFYQQDYDHDEGRYSVLQVTSDSGLTFVYSGYFMLCIGIFWYFWFTKLWPKGR